MPKAASQVQQTPAMDFLFGSYSRAEIKIPYFQVNFKFSAAKEYLKLVSEMPDSDNMPWRIEELFQRDIDWKRVDRKIVPYLRDETNSQFFNSLTIALIPIKNGEIRQFDEDCWHTAELKNPDLTKTICCGPITCGFWEDWDDVNADSAKIGQIAWNCEEISAIAIDGQHRLAAIKKVIGLSPSSYNNCTVPVILLILDEKLGYTGNTTRKGMIETLRSIFIDLNKHAKIPSRSRQILLDDRDPVSLCVRNLIGNELSEDLNEISAVEPRLPLSLVDWHSEQAKFEKGPYIVTVLGLEFAIITLLQISSISDPLDYRKLKAVIKNLEKKLDINLENASRILEVNERFEQPFAFLDNDENELELIARGFTTKWSQVIINLLTNFVPYHKIIKLRESTRTQVPSFCNWYVLKSKVANYEDGEDTNRLREMVSRLQSQSVPISTREYDNALERMDDVKGEYLLAFTVVFQRSIFQVLKELFGLSDSDFDFDDYDLDNIDEFEVDLDNSEMINDIDVRSKFLVDSLNRFLDREPEFLKKEFKYNDINGQEQGYFWLGSFVKIDYSIDYTKEASKRASNWLMLIVCMFAFKERGVDGNVQCYDDLKRSIVHIEDNFTREFEKAIARLVGSGDSNSVARRIVLALNKEEDDERRLAEIKNRVVWIWSVVNASR